MDPCLCSKFVFWYNGGHGIRICRCGHPERDHVERTDACLGDVIVL